MHIFWKANEAYVAMVTNAAWVREITFSGGEGTEQGNEKVVILLLMRKNAFLNISFREKNDGSHAVCRRVVPFVI